jgi:hypothetical protein
MSFHAGGLMVEARRAYELGDLERAKRICTMIVQLQPQSAESEEAAALLGLPVVTPAPEKERAAQAAP